MVWTVLFVGGGICALLSLLVIPRLFQHPAPSTATLSFIKNGLLWVAGIIATCTAFISLLAAAWGMDTRLPWGLDIYPFLIPVLSLLAFFLLLFASVRILSAVLWILVVANGLSWLFADRVTRLASGWQPKVGWEAVGMFFNAFTIVLFLVAVMVQTAAVCEYRYACLNENSKLEESAP